MTTTIEYVLFESSPFAPMPVVDSHGGRVMREDLLAECGALPDEYYEALNDLSQRVDNARCARCDDTVGFALFSYSDVERIAWCPTGLARHGDGPVAVLCETCTPWLPED